jgi:integrase
MATTVLEICNSYLLDLTDTAKPQTINLYRSLLRQIPNLLLRPAHEVTEREVTASLRGLSAGRSNQLLGLLKSAFASAIRNRVVKENPAVFLRQRRVERKAIHPVTPDELERIAAVAKGWTGRFFTVAYYTGARPRELLAVTWDDVSESAIRITKTMLPDGTVQPTTKSPSGVRTIPLCAPARAAFEAMKPLARGAFVFHNANDRPMDLTTIRAEWKAALRACGLPSRPLYSCRSGFCGLALDRGYTAREISVLMGHATPAMVLNTYSRGGRAPASLDRLVG